MSEPVAWNRAERRRRGMTRSRLKRTGSLASAGMLVSAGLFGAYVGNPRLQRAYASPVCSGAVRVTGPGDDTLVAALDDSTVTCIEIQGQITLSADLPVITDDSWSGGPRDSALGLTLYGVGGDDTIDGLHGGGNLGGLAISLASPLGDTVRLSVSDLAMINLGVASAGALSLQVDDTVTPGSAENVLLLLSNSTFTNDYNSSGGPVRVSAAHREVDVTARDDTFVGNGTSRGGGAMEVRAENNRADVSVCGSHFAYNEAGSGGAIYATSTTPGTLRINHPSECSSGPTILLGNSAGDDTGGGAIFTGLDVDIYDAHFTGNTAYLGVSGSPNGGGAIAGANSNDDTLSVRVFESTFMSNTSYEDGGAISLPESGGLTTTYLYLKDDTFSGNEAATNGGALAPTAWHPQTVIRGSTFTNNTARAGGAISADGLVRIDAPGGGPDPSIFSLNTASYGPGGAISYANDGVKVYDGAQFLHNSASFGGGAISSYGRVDVSGAIFAVNSSGASGGAIAGDSVYADNGAQFLDNSARNGGGAIIAYRAGLDRVLIEGNAAHQFGGGVAVTNGLLTVSNSTIYDNTAGNRGGGISADDSVTVSYSAIIGNRAGDDTYANDAGGGIATGMFSSSEVLLTNSYVGGNQADDTAGGIFLPGSHSHLGLYFSTVYDDSSANSAFPSGIMVAGALTAVGSVVGNSFGTLPWYATSADDTYFISSHLPVGGWTPGSGSRELGPGVGLGLGLRDDTVTPGHAGRTPLASSPLAVAVADGGFAPATSPWPTVTHDQLDDTRVAPFTIGARQVVAPAPPPGPSGVVPSAPRDPRAVAGDRQAVVSWVEPADSGSFPITDYEVTSVPSGGSCLVKVPSLSCTVSGLDNGTSYVFRVRALNGAGWSPESVASNGVTPRPGPSILVTGTRDGNRVRVRGATQGVTSSTVTPRYHFAGEVDYETGVARPRINATGEFTWSRIAGRTIYVYFAADGTRSNRLVFRSRG